MDILAIGEPLMELSAVSDEKRGRLYLPGFGGDTSNFCVAAARQGARVGYLTRLGTDFFGDQFINLWQSEGIDTTLVVRDDNAHTGLYFISYTDDGHEFTYLRRGSAASRLKPEDISEKDISGTRLLHVSGISQAISDTACDAVFRAVEIAKSNGVMVSYDPNLRLKLWPIARARAIIMATAVQADIFLPSLEDSQQMLNIDEPGEIADFYLENGIKLVVLKLGRQGALIASAEGRHFLKGYKVDTLDATGAGDTFDGAFCSQLLKGVSPTEAAKFANAAAALSTLGYGAVTPIPDKKAVLAFLEKNN